MPFERIEPGTSEYVAYYANHIHRYMFAAVKLKELGKHCVLDAACGVGYGAKYLAEAGAVRVTAVDYDLKVLSIAAAQFFHPEVTLCKDDCHTLAKCGEDGSFDAVVSFETVEHLPRPVDFLTRCRELLVPDGLMVISTPNVRVGNSTSKMEWNYHEREYTSPEFVALLVDAGFRDVTLYGQRLTALGQLREEVRAELNKLRSNPFIRTGRWLQKVLRGHQDTLPVLPERVDDFEIVSLPSAGECDALGKDGPLVLICLAFS